MVAETSCPAFCQCNPANAGPGRGHHHHRRFCDSTVGAANPGADTQHAERLARHSHPYRIRHEKLSRSPRGVAAHAIGLVGGVASFVFAILLLVFVLASPRPLVAAYLALAPDRYREQAHRTLARLMRQMTAWARGVAINGIITGLSIGVSLWLIGVQPALIFGVFAFLGEFLPTIGAFLVSIPILLVALSMGATKFWLALLVIVIVYQVELNVLVPGVLGKEMRLHPVNILFFTLATATMFGLLGVFLAVPAAALVQIVIDEFYLQPRKPDYTALDTRASPFGLPVCVARVPAAPLCETPMEQRLAQTPYSAFAEFQKNRY
ncbi:MAG: hypothetical protein DMF24_11150 [Verrucomicrobia bacterium]|nr:MAG: hypothetical protein DMF24_11150 [Verrucomicrobiota bacterium]